MLLCIQVLVCRQVVHALAATGEHCYSEFHFQCFFDDKISAYVCVLNDGVVNYKEAVVAGWCNGNSVVVLGRFIG